MRYWYDTEFIDDGRAIELLSIGIVAEDGRELYLENGEADHNKAGDWVRQNVIPHLHACTIAVDGVCQEKCPVRTRAEMAAIIDVFCSVEHYGKPEFWGYYSSYDHVALCQLFGAMIDLPKGWPMYTRDLKQWCDSLGNPELPKQGKDEHHAIADALWNRKAWEFLRDFESQRANAAKFIAARNSL